jgi:hypothetical protein
MKPKIYNIIPIFLLSISLLSADQVYAVDNNITENLIIAQNPNKKANISQALQHLKDAVKSFNDDIREVVAGNKNQNEVNSKNILKKLDSLNKELASLSEKPENTQTSKGVKNINFTISELDKIINTLENGLTNDRITQVQKNLNFFKRRNIEEKFYGTVGQTTQEEIEKFTNNKINELDTQIESLLNKKEVKSTNAISPQPQKSPGKAKNDGLELNAVKSSLSNLTITLIILGFILLGLIIFCIYITITLVKQQRQITNSLRNNHNQKFINIDKFQIELNEIYKWVNNFDARLKQIESSSYNKTNKTSSNYSSNYPPTSPNISTSQPRTEQVYQPQPPQPRINQSYQPANISNTNIGLVSAYNINPRSLSEQAISVSETKYTSEQRRLGENIQPILESNSRGNYWIITEGNNEYLVPKANIKINEYNYVTTISTFFNCLGYSSNSPNNFTLVKPAKVSSRGEQWELIEIGELQF